MGKTAFQTHCRSKQFQETTSHDPFQVQHCHPPPRQWRHRRQDPRRHGRRQNPLGHAGAGVFRHHPELHRPRRTRRHAADPGQGNELDGDGLRQHQLLVPGRLRHRLRAARPLDRPGRRQARVLLRSAALEPGDRRPRPGHLGGRLHGLPLHPRADRSRQLPGLREDHAAVVPGRRARRGHRHLQRRHQRRCDVHPDAAATDPARVGLAGRVPVHVGIGLDLVAVLGLEVLQPGRSPERETDRNWTTSSRKSNRNRPAYRSRESCACAAPGPSPLPTR